jgi:hypothetical protein
MKAHYKFSSEKYNQFANKIIIEDEENIEKLKFDRQNELIAEIEVRQKEIKELIKESEKNIKLSQKSINSQ